MIFLLKLWIILIGIVIFIFGSYTLLYYIYSKKGEKKKLKKDFFPTVTLVVPFYNEEIVLKTKIENTAKIKYPRNKLEVIFLNDHSTDNSINIIKANAKKLPFKFKIINNPNKQGKSNALNYLLPKIKKEITIITDTDSLIKEDAIQNLVKNFQDEKVGGANARIIILKPKSENTSYNEEKNYRFFYDMWRKGESNIHSISVCNGPLMSFRTDLLKDIILISGKGYSADDSQLTFFVIKKGYRVLYDTSSIVYEVTPPNSSERFRQKMRRARGLIRLYLRNLRILGKGKFGLIIYPYALLTHIFTPYIVLLASLIYLLLLYKIPFYCF